MTPSERAELDRLRGLERAENEAARMPAARPAPLPACSAVSLPPDNRELPGGMQAMTGPGLVNAAMPWDEP